MLYFKGLLALLLLVLPFAVVAWEQMDIDIFDLVHTLHKAHGPESSFYSLLHVSPSATIPEIVRAHRKVSLSVHPDKNQSPEAREEYNLLSAVTRTLKNPETRSRYDFFLKNGVPARAGGTYLYSRHRPGLGNVLVFLAIFLSAVQYLLAYVERWRKMSLWRELQEDEASLRRPLPRKGGRGQKPLSPQEVVEEEVMPDFPLPRVQDLLVFSVPWFIVKSIIAIPMSLVRPAPADVGKATPTEASSSSPSPKKGKGKRKQVPVHSD